jgi:hypothetical protein
MVFITAVVILRDYDDGSHLLAQSTDLRHFGFFEKGSCVKISLLDCLNCCGSSHV